MPWSYTCDFPQYAKGLQGTGTEELDLLTMNQNPTFADIAHW